MSVASTSRRTLPTFFIIGAPKTGTTSLHYYLEQHPDVQMSSVKEPGYFAPPPDDLHLKRVISRLDRYEQLFDSRSAVRGEASTNYAEYPFRQGVPERIRALVPDAKLIYVVRDPVARTVSHFNHMAATGAESRSLQEVCSDLTDPRIPCLCASLYALQLELYLCRFSRGQMLVIDQARLLGERRETLREIFAFLEVDESFDCSRFDLELLKGAEHRAYAPWLARLVERTLRPRSAWVPAEARRALRRNMERIFLVPLEESRPGDGLRARLEEFFAPDVARLRALTGNAFSSWSV